jgi:hypothetical protein
MSAPPSWHGSPPDPPEPDEFELNPDDPRTCFACGNLDRSPDGCDTCNPNRSTP